MKPRMLMAAWAGGLLLLGLTPCAAPAQETQQTQETTADDLPPTAVPPAVGMLDVNYIFKHYPRFKESLAEMKTDMQRAEEEAKKKQEALRGMQRQLQLLGVGTPEYAKLEKEIATSKAELTGTMESQKKAFLRREARLYYDVYEEMLAEVEAYAQARNLALVLRFNDVPVNLGEPKDVLRHVNKGVIWYDKKRDITRIILERLTQRSKQSEPGGEVVPQPPQPPLPPAGTQSPAPISRKEPEDGQSHRTTHSG